MSPQLFAHRTSTSRIVLTLSAPALAAAILAAGSLSASAQPQPTSAALAASLDRTGTVFAYPGRAAAAAPVAGDSDRVLIVWDQSPKQIAWQMLPIFRWRPRFQFRYLNWLWMRESSWNVHAFNPYSGALGIPQAVPGDKMASAGPNWRSGAATQILWGLRYIRGRYGSPRAAWAHESAYGWY